MNAASITLGGYLLLVAVAMFGMDIPKLLLAIVALLAAICVLAGPWIPWNRP